MKIFKNIIFLLLFLPVLLFAQENREVEDDLLEQLRNMSLEDILEVKISVTSGIPLSMREAPGIVTLITREDILNSGARDLIDILTMLVPGMDFLQSEFGPIGIGMRNIWAYEGKVLILIDGMEANEEGFQGFIFGNHFGTENIERIEVIRGPGSVIYGGSAGLGVINIITRKFEEKPGSYIGLQISRMYETFSHRNLAFGTGDREGEFKYSLTGFIGQGRLSDRNFVPYFSSDKNLYSGSKITFNPFHLNAGLEYHGYKYQMFIESYKTEFDIPFKFYSVIARIEKDFQLTKDLVLTTTFNGKFQQPWQIKSQGHLYLNGTFIDTAFSNNKKQSRYSAALKLQWNIFEDLYLLGGAEYVKSEVDVEPIEGYFEIPFGATSQIVDDIDLGNKIAFAQLMYKHKIMNITIGGRYEATENFGDSFVPRIAFTKIFDKFHFKMMASKSFRIPGGKYYDLNLRPEKGTIYELEIGYQFSKNHFMVVNLYDILYRDMIGFEYNDDQTSYVYANTDRIRSQGIEFEYKYVSERFRIGTNFSYSRIGENSNDIIAVPDDSRSVLGFPALKMNMFMGVEVSEHLSINPSVTLHGSRYGYIGGEIDNSIVPVYYPSLEFNQLKEFSASPIVNLNFQMIDIFTKGMNVDLGIRNLFNTDFEYIQPFGGFKAPIPAATSSLVLRIYYESDFTFF
ncbi:MAG: hypothetical protein SCALA702_23680 [Melioribacteraceae bacterium]|nr:MAG: hypothetical protein SCALA702_23680 [Melioribacteraceae bacterium]